MLESIDFSNAKFIVEYGPGTGAFTEKLLSRVKEDTLVLLVETNKEFFEKLNVVYLHKNNVLIFNESAEKIDEILNEYGIHKVNYIISGLPFASLPKEVSDNLLNKTSKILGHNGEFITFQYSLLKTGLFKKFFKEINIDRALRNLPPAYILKCRI